MSKEALVIYLPDGKTQAYHDVSGLSVENGLTTFYYKGFGKKRKITTTLPVLLDEEAGQPRVTTL
jgi:hypothetical protein